MYIYIYTHFRLYEELQLKVMTLKKKQKEKSGRDRIMTINGVLELSAGSDWYLLASDSIASSTLSVLGSKV